jgi:hypothetical protein
MASGSQTGLDQGNDDEVASARNVSCTIQSEHEE